MPRGGPTLAVYRPRLPRAEAILPYLRAMDASRLYANRGELMVQLEARLSERLHLGDRHIVCTGSGTSGLIAAILAAAGRATPERPVCLCPGYMFVAGAMAAELCGYEPTFVDVDPATWRLSPAAVLAHPNLPRTGVILTVAPYGQPVASAEWSDVRARTGVPVVIDAAASVEAFADEPHRALDATPIVFSFHATKAFACGEGGAVVSSDTAFLHRVYAALNFGFENTREVAGPGFNGKMSEYHAAVGLAELDGWSDKRCRLAQTAAAYRREGAGHGVTIHAAPQVASNYVLLEAAGEAHAVAVCAALDREAIDWRLWYGRGVQHEPQYRSARRPPLPGVDRIATRLIGLPVADDLADSDIARVVRTIAAVSPA